MSKRSNVINQICTLIESLSASDRRIADFILASPKEVETLTVRELAARTQTSAATVSRFARTLGYKSFSDLRIAVAVSNGGEEDEDQDSALEFSEFEEAVQFFLSQKVAELQETAGFVDEKDFKQFAECCMRADMVLIAGVGNTVNMAANAAFKFCQAGIRAVSYPTIDAATSAAMMLTENDVLLVLSTSGYSKRLVTCVEHAEDNNATILMVTDNPDTPIASRAKHIIRTATRDFVLAKNSAFSHNSMNFVIEMLFLYFHALQENAPEWNKMLVRGLGQDKLYDSDEVLLG